MADSADIPSIIRDRALANGVDPDQLLQMATVESGLNPNSASPSSSAKGLFQFTDPTWKQYGNGADPLDATANADAGARFMANNQKLLSSAGVDVTPGSTYLAHFAGPGGALKVLKADPTTPVASLLDPSAIKANPFLAKMSAADLQSWADSKMSGASGAPRPTQVASGNPAPAQVGSGFQPASSDASATAPDSLSPELMAQLQAIPTMLAKQQADVQPAAAAAPPPLPDPSTVARARIVARAIAGQPLA